MRSERCVADAYSSQLNAGIQNCGGKAAVEFTLRLPASLFEPPNTSSNEASRRLNEKYVALIESVRDALRSALIGVNADDLQLTVNAVARTVRVVILEGGLSTDAIMSLTASRAFLRTIATTLGVESISFAKHPLLVVVETSLNNRNMEAALVVPVVVVLLLFLAALLVLASKLHKKHRRRTVPYPPDELRARMPNASMMYEATPELAPTTHVDTVPSARTQGYCKPQTASSPLELACRAEAEAELDAAYAHVRRLEASMIASAEAEAAAASPLATAMRMDARTESPAFTCSPIRMLGVYPREKETAASLHSGWTEHTSGEGVLYWFHGASGTSSWTRPTMPVHGLARRPLPPMRDAPALPSTVRML
jgi:hypothetical protein